MLRAPTPRSRGRSFPLSDKKGIVDPWRVVEPLRAPPKKAPPPPGRIAPADLDRDRDLRDSYTHNFRCAHGNIEVTSRDIETDSDALRELVGCLFALLETRTGPGLFDASIGFSLGGRVWNRQPGKPSTGLSADEAAVYFCELTFDQGMLVLIRNLSQVKRQLETGPRILARWGVKPHLK